MADDSINTDNSSNIAIEDTPGILYKYAQWKDDHNHLNDERLKRLIAGPEIYLSSIKQFNDPYDCGLSLRYDLWSEEDFKIAWRQLLKYDNPLLKPVEIEKKLQEILQEYRNDPDYHIRDFQYRQYKFIREKIGIFCLSEINDNMLMWSHYSDKHKGVCIGYKTHELEKCIQEHIESLQPKSKWIYYIKVNYEDSYPIIRPNTNMSDSRNFVKILKTKIHHWSYEKEWRLTVGVNRAEMAFTERDVKISIDVIAEIYLGLQMQDDKDIKDMKTELRRQNYSGKLFRLMKGDYSYQLEYDDISSELD